MYKHRGEYRHTVHHRWPRTHYGYGSHNNAVHSRHRHHYTEAWHRAADQVSNRNHRHDHRHLPGAGHYAGRRGGHASLRGENSAPRLNGKPSVDRFVSSLIASSTTKRDKNGRPIPGHKKAENKYDGWCAATITDALHHAGFQKVWADANALSKHLHKLGFEPVARKGYVPHKGDLAIISPDANHPIGDAAGFDGKHWRSDAKHQNGVSPYGPISPTRITYYRHQEFYAQAVGQQLEGSRALGYAAKHTGLEGTDGSKAIRGNTHMSRHSSRWGGLHR